MAQNKRSSGGGRHPPRRMSWYYTCLAKRAYADEAEVRGTLARLRTRYRERLYYYQCPFCGKFHLTKQEQQT